MCTLASLKSLSPTRHNRFEFIISFHDIQVFSTDTCMTDVIGEIRGKIGKQALSYLHAAHLLRQLQYVFTTGYLCIYKVCYETIKSPWSQTTVIVAKQIVLVTIQIYWFRPGKSILLMLIHNKYSFHKKLGLRLATNYSWCLLNKPLQISKADTKIFIGGFKQRWEGRVSSHSLVEIQLKLH